jgi:DUF4097 and DUF4098 domain-containing protein YvlB
MISLKSICRYLLLAILILSFGMLPQVAAQREERVFKVSGLPAVTLRNISGDIEVTTWNRPEVKVEAAKTSTDVTVEMEQVGDTIRVATRYPSRSSNLFGNRGTVDYFISMPAEGNLDVNSISGKVLIDTLRGDLQVETISGNIELRRIGKRVSAHCVSGDITLTQGNLDADLTTISGAIVVTEVEGRMNFGSVSGDVKLLRSKASRLSVSTTSGDIEVDTPMEKGGTYRINSHSGYVGITLPRHSSFELSARTFSGDLQTDLPLTVTAPESKFRHGRAVKGTYGKGDASVELQTFSGDIRIISK